MEHGHCRLALDPLELAPNNTIHMTKQSLSAVLLCTALLATTNATAQGPVFGIKGGLNYSTLAVDEADSENSRVGFNLGFFGRSGPDQPLGVQVELLYSTKGSSTTYNALFGLIEQEVEFNLNYLELPVLASFRVGEIVDLQLGGYGAYLISANASSSGDLGSGSEELDRDNFKSVDFGIAGGVGFNLGTNAQLGIRYLHGLSKVAESDAADFVLGDAKNRCAQLYLAIGIGR